MVIKKNLHEKCLKDAVCANSLLCASAYCYSLMQAYYISTASTSQRILTAEMQKEMKLEALVVLRFITKSKFLGDISISVHVQFAISIFREGDEPRMKSPKHLRVGIIEQAGMQAC